ncbi:MULTISPECIES: UDP-N-acetylmuramyl peptide synthase [unclassified Legionella]|uniref:UDP-N-acetylmuramyl peptide synthase n=1 Tax=unclassified Legionella TaxID=2622702 RepID=UPI0010566306|nr:MULTISPECIES: UDP-N-acetylmuramyl peptide synthase [unclassified Legionella]MDI9819158.1 UDP-N-acetylmuramyl peptide synthase [Legionella sp. PL877]
MDAITDRNIRLYYESALKLHLPVDYIPELNTMQITLGGRNYYFSSTITPINNGGGIFISRNKYKFNKLLESYNFPVPNAVAVSKENFERGFLADLIKDLQFPVVAKPIQDTGRGKDVFCGIKDIETLSNYLRSCFEHYAFMQVEEFHTGLKEYRVLVLKNRVIGVVQRFGAEVIGDGKHSIRQLIDIKNEERIKLSPTLTISPLVIDEEYKTCLAEQGLSVDSTPSPGQKVRLSYTANTGRGGEIFSLGKKIKKENAKILCTAAKIAGLDIVGMDVLCEDINLSFKKSKWLIIEGNFAPDTTIHEIPNYGEKVNVTQLILKKIISRHPLSYLSHLFTNSKFSVFIKGILIITVLGILIASLRLAVG